MAKVEVVLPQMGEGIIEATITRWLAEVNTDVKEDDSIVEIATDKVDSEIPSPVSGKLVKQFFSEGEIPKVGDVIAIIDDGKEAGIDSYSDVLSDVKKNIETQKKQDTEKKKQIASHRKSNLDAATSIEHKNTSPFIRYFAKQRGITSKELIKLKGSGVSGQLTKSDIFNYLKEGRLFRYDQENNYLLSQKDEGIVQDYIPKEGEIVLKLDRTRSLIAEHMVRSVLTAPHVTSFVEADITPLVSWRNSIKADFKERQGVSLTFTPIITEVVVQALKEYPKINASLVQGNLILKKYINIGIATVLPDGNLIVPVVKNADTHTLTKLALEIYDKTSRARIGKLAPGESAGGTFTITNLGQVGNISGTPIINQPESAILAVGAIKKKPGVVENQGEYTIGIRDIITLSLSYDHRIVDGALGGAFLTRVGELLENYTTSQKL
jgi:2-oxoglutarate dehydrogenase E2 component (dihydrolipoamide succinyltransferase)